MSYSYLSDNRSGFKLKDKYQSAGKSELPGSSENPNDDKNVEKNKSDKQKQQPDSVASNSNGKIHFPILNLLNLIFRFGTILMNQCSTTRKGRENRRSQRARRKINEG